MKVGIIGCGKRFQNVYHKILSSLGWETYVWNRTSEKSRKFCQQNSINHVENLTELVNLPLELVLCFVPSEHQYDLVKDIRFDKVMLLETPITDIRLFGCATKLGVLEQWPKLPLEQFKEVLYRSNAISRPYLVFNDGRSFDYHAISQLRTYLGRPMPSFVKGTNKSYENTGVIDSENKLNNRPFDWTLGQIEMQNGSVLQYSFSYNCKSLSSIPIQFLRAYSNDGSIVSGRMKEIGNDYEIVDVRYVDKLTRQTHAPRVNVTKNGNVTESISLIIEEKFLEWRNPYAKNNFDDQQTAIATMLEDATRGVFYPCKEAYVDLVCINAIKSSGYTQNTVRLQ